MKTEVEVVVTVAVDGVFVLGAVVVGKTIVVVGAVVLSGPKPFRKIGSLSSISSNLAPTLRIHSIKVESRVYPPGMLGLAQPRPKETTAIWIRRLPL